MDRPLYIKRRIIMKRENAICGQIRIFVLAIMLTAVLIGFTTFSNAELVNNGGGLIYDTCLNITWYDYSYYGLGSGVTWDEAMSWADSLTVGGTTGWRLPSSDYCQYENCTGSDMGHLYYTDLGFAEGTPVSPTNQFPFSNLQSDFYWSATQQIPIGNDAIAFGFSNGLQGPFPKTGDPWGVGLYAIAVHSGNVGSPVPYANFGSNGIWMYSGTTWSQVTPNNPEAMVSSGSTLYGAFSGAGIWMHNGTTWSQVTPNNPEAMVSSGSSMYGDFGSSGIWKWDGFIWSQTTPSNPQMMTASGSTLYGAFSGAGIWQWNGSSWSQTTPSNPEAILASGSNLYGDFGSSGIWMHNGTTWGQTTPSNPQMMTASGSTLYGAFSGAGIWMHNGTAWSQLSPLNPEQMVCTATDLYVDFGSAGIWKYNGTTWSQVTPNDPTSMVVGY
jgi:hypothetical protein